MKKLTLSLFLFLLTIALWPQANVNAREDTETIVIEEPTSIDYFLAYPGLLPDHPLYPLKMLRDKIIEFFLTDPIKKARFYLLQADKHLGAARMLVDKGRTKLGAETLVESQNFFARALDELIKARDQGRDSEALFSKLSLANLKHRQIINQMRETAPSEIQENLGRALTEVQSSRSRLNQIIGENFEESQR